MLRAVAEASVETWIIVMGSELGACALQAQSLVNEFYVEGQSDHRIDPKGNWHESIAIS